MKDRSTQALAIQNQFRDIFSCLNKVSKSIDELNMEYNGKDLYRDANRLYNTIKDEYDFVMDDDIKKQLEQYVENVKIVLTNIAVINKSIKNIQENLQVAKEYVNKAAQIIDVMI
ncbi:hypothetical protein [Thermosipho sp. (in: thermotogales)]|jgi:uncharacterized alpha-E superfamily protein|uniref:hypothetical protein n=1 Tax=Thermosipho sp. (in: thermotogales) TaxID=1968895 RepID=UPI00257A25C2|nr:hypothetical protein [Thermosipho sp. (in: thermotogales)]MBZ4649241.1 hypothetical protein [Thermosipho sp. (in: thermotogales)]